MKHFSPDNFQNCTLGLLLGRAALLKDRIIDTHMEPYGITAAQFKVLIIMAQFEVDTPAELCRHLCIDSGSMTRMLDRLEQKKLLVRQRSEADRRAYRGRARAGRSTPDHRCCSHEPVGWRDYPARTAKS